MSDEPKITNSAEEMAGFIKGMRPMSLEDSQQVLAYYKDFYFDGKSTRIGARVIFNPVTKEMILAVKVGDEEFGDKKTIKQFVSYVSHIHLEDLWENAGLLVP